MKCSPTLLNRSMAALGHHSFSKVLLRQPGILLAVKKSFDKRGISWLSKIPSFDLVAHLLSYRSSAHQVIQMNDMHAASHMPAGNVVEQSRVTTPLRRVAVIAVQLSRNSCCSGQSLTRGPLSNSPFPEFETENLQLELRDWLDIPQQTVDQHFQIVELEGSCCLQQLISKGQACPLLKPLMPDWEKTCSENRDDAAESLDPRSRVVHSSSSDYNLHGPSKSTDREKCPNNPKTKQLHSLRHLPLHHLHALVRTNWTMSLPSAGQLVHWGTA
jgi:hypothetical protein